MSRCLHITFWIDAPQKFLHNGIQKFARTLGLEGTVQVANGGGKLIKLLVCGERDSMDDFLDFLHKEVAKDAIKNMEIEPFIKERDFRGVFRIIE
jgi:acylphosphatase